MLLAGVGVLCFFRWQVWFGNPAEPRYTGDTLTYRLPCFGDDSVPGFIRSDSGFVDTIQPHVLRLILLGDVHNQVDSAQYAALLLRHDSVDAYAQSGDWMERGYFYYEQQLLHQLAGTGLDILPVISCPGNHEYHKGFVRRLPDFWTDLFRHPMNGSARFQGTTYYVDFPNLRCIVIDTNGLQRLSDYTIVLTWLKRVMASAGDRFTMVIMHHPVYSAGMGRQNIPIRLTFRRQLSKADIVFAGHDHNYARRMPFIDTNSAHKFYLNKVHPRAARIASGQQLYELVEVENDTLRVATMLLDTALVYDRIAVVRTHNADMPRLVTAEGIGQEYIALPDKYKNRNDLKVRRFLHRRQYRLEQDSLNNIQTLQIAPLVKDSTAVAQ